MYPYYSQIHGQGALPPGQYMYTNELLKTMSVTQPAYTIKFEPIFFHHLMMHMNKKLQVTTVNEVLTGDLTGVAVDHLQLTIDEVDYHIRFEHIIHFRMV